MDKAVIFGVYEFVSFHACKTLLDKGVEVVGIHINEIENNFFLEDKRLEIGRNANFNEQTLAELENYREEADVKTAFILSVYDLYVLNKEAILRKEKVIESIFHFLERNQNHIELILLLPIQMLGTNREIELTDFLNKAGSRVKNSQIFYLPAIYGPWQPKAFLFQQAIISKFQKQELRMANREWTNDVLFVEDAAASIFEILETRKYGGLRKSYLLISGKKSYWTSCAAFLHIEEALVKSNTCEPLNVDNEIVTVSVNVTSIEDSITKQIEHVNRLFPTDL
ncbi:hypothetical protein [Neobacillus vireti]|uniref:NAD-dependent epimerase/dehydratase n=1 Tax=Neobacillus vireti LMG 21834 TaxID=1131730 RepID=A0AB94INL3_9BACI|nr:hypothetical protein [Neobacillus vireti]ETI68634.1 NAD-dependent epimerase/dehydratase [Neobacillus vireti LMG 21834]KLT19236.1 hypothetical protein AA980_01100 [Neobacillus vireti]